MDETYLADDDLQAFHSCGDPLADQLSRELLGEGLGSWPASGNLYQFIKEQAPSKGGAYAALVDHSETIPPWLDPGKLLEGQRLLGRTSPFAMAVLVFGVLGRTYAPGPSADVLAGTGRLESGVLRRLYETADMVQKMLAPGAMEPGAQGHEAIIRVRLMHSLVRTRILASQRWPHRHQAPISQLESALVGLEFIYCVIDGLERLGLLITAKEKDGYLHLWRYAHYLQGIDLRLIPARFELLKVAYEQYRQRLWSPNGNSEKLMASLLRGLDGKPPFYLPKVILEALAAFLMEDELHTGLGLRPKPYALRLVRVFAWVNASLSRRHKLFPAMKNWEVRWGERYFKRIVSTGLGGQSANFLA